MRRNQPRRAIVYAPRSMQALAGKVNAFHAEVIERRLRQSALTAEEKAAAIDRLLQSMPVPEDERNSISE